MISSITAHTLFFFFFFNDPPTTEIYTLSLPAALPISSPTRRVKNVGSPPATWPSSPPGPPPHGTSPAASERSPSSRSEEHTSELQSQSNLVCRLLLEKKKTYINTSNECTQIPQFSRYS